MPIGLLVLPMLCAACAAISAALRVRRERVTAFEILVEPAIIISTPPRDVTAPPIRDVSLIIDVDEVEYEYEPIDPWIEPPYSVARGSTPIGEVWFEPATDPTIDDGVAIAELDLPPAKSPRHTSATVLIRNAPRYAFDDEAETSAFARPLAVPPRSRLRSPTT